jgi:endonuclease III
VSAAIATPADGRARLKTVLVRPRKAHGPRKWQRWGDAVSVLVETILSQNTSNANSAAGFANLRARFADWDELANAAPKDIEACIRVCGLAKIKAPRIRAILRQVRQERGRISLEHLRRLPPAEAYEQLTRFKGVGPKTAWCVLMFSFGMKVFPVDTHIHRIAARLGLIGPRVSAEGACEILTPMIAPASRYEMHVLLIAHGRRVCLARRPRCEQCTLLSLCPHGQAEMEKRMNE